MIVKLMDGLSLECNYIPQKEIHTYDNIVYAFITLSENVKLCVVCAAINVNFKVCVGKHMWMSMLPKVA